MKNNTISFDNVNLAATLQALHHNVSVNKISDSPFKVTFSVEKTENTETIVQSFWNNTILVPPVAFQNARFTIFQSMNSLRQ